MSQHIISNGGRAPEVSDTHVVALYDPASGRIFHIHNVTVFKGARAVTESEAIDTAMAHASAAGHPIERLKVKVSKDPAHGRSPHRIDPTTNTFVAIEAKSRRLIAESK